MTAKQKANRARFKAAAAEAKKLRKKNPSLSQAQAVKQAWAIMYSKKGKRIGENHKDTKSHNVNIRVVSGIGKYVKTTRRAGKTYVQYKTKKRVGALPVGFTGKILGVPFEVSNQYNIDGTVTAQIVIEGKIIAELNGRPNDVQVGFNNWLKAIKQKSLPPSWYRDQTKSGYDVLQDKEKKEIDKKITSFLQQLNKEVRDFNSGKDTKTKKAKSVNISPKKSRAPKKSGSLKDDIKDLLRTEKKRMKYGYKIVPGKVRGFVNISGVPGYSDPDAVRELTLFADNDYDLYRMRKRPILINLGKKHQKGTYDIDKAAKLWKYFIDDAMKKYTKEYGSGKWYNLLSMGDRNLLALEYARDTKEEFDMGNYTN